MSSASLPLLPRLEAAAAHLRDAGLESVPPLALVLGSGLGSIAARLEGAKSVPYAAIPHWPAAQVAGHAGELRWGSLAGVPVLMLCGRAHAYEGHSQAAVAFGVQVLARLGVRQLILTNAAGGIAPHFAVGDLMVICDHLNLTGANPLAGPHDARLGPQFFDMGAAYCPTARAHWHLAAQRAGLRLQEGVYAGVLGPNFETPAEIRMLGRLGADAVGMSTVAETIAARQLGLQVAGLSLISNLAAGLSPTPLSHAEVAEMGARQRPRIIALLEQMVQLS